ncbi:MAG: helix-turn-helix domain-containing protein [Pseudomonadota bacterium]
MATNQALRSDPKDEPDPHPGRFAIVRSVHRFERNVELCECMIDIAAALYNVSGRDLRHPGRSSHSVARVRQIAMYVAHVALGLSMNEVGRGFGRDRTTVLHACHLVEDMREDQEFDRIIAMTERVASAALRNRDGAY